MVGVALLVLVAGCDGGAPRAVARASATPALSRESERDAARGVLERAGCNECHAPSVPASPPPGSPAVVFDLGDEEWTHRMSDAQLRSLAFPTPHQDPSSSLSAPDLAVVRRFVETELAHRTKR